jgi:hypothetical protein
VDYRVSERLEFIIRRQVNPQSGSVRLDASTVIVISGDAQTNIRERYRVEDRNHFTYIMDMSRDGGRSWDAILVEMTTTKVD